MRKTPRAYPTICFDGRMKCRGIYYANVNLIKISRDRCRAKTAVDTLIHEETHWVEDMYLTAREVEHYYKGMPKGKRPRKWIVEKVAEEVAKEITERIFNDTKRKR